MEFGADTDDDTSNACRIESRQASFAGWHVVMYAVQSIDNWLRLLASDNLGMYISHSSL
jgi:hypothetical protein